MNKEVIKTKLSGLRNISRGTIISLAVIVLLAVLGVLDYNKVLSLGSFQGSIALIAAAEIIFIISTFIIRKRKSRTFNFMSKMAIAAAVLELTLFQFPSYHIFLSDYEEREFFPTDAQLSGENYNVHNEHNSVEILGTSQLIMDFKDLNMTVGTIMADVEFPKDSKRINLWIDMADETHVEPRGDVASSSIINGVDGSEYMTCRFSGDVSQLKLKFSCSKDYEKAVIKKIYLNKMIPFDISALRFCFLTFGITFCYAVAVSGFFKKPFKQTKKFTTGSILALTAVSVALVTAVTLVQIPDDEFKLRWKLEEGDQITQELVDAFEAGQFHLLKEPTQELLDVENPYDWGQRNSNEADYEWDHVLYDGKYYSYYGVAPVLTVFLPYHMMTGYYFSDDMAVWIFSGIGLIFLGLTYIAITRRWFRNVPTGCVLAAYIILIVACGIWYSPGRSLFYEISISCGFMYLCAGVYFFISSNVLSKQKISYVRTALASLFIGLAVLSRPTLAVYAVCAALFWILSMKKSSKTLAGRIVYALCAVIPIGALGIFQMWYNYARFDSPFDFGIQYSLTINDFVHSQFHLLFVGIGLFNYLFAAPTITPNYPYVKTEFSGLYANGYYFADTGNTSGIVFLALPVLGYLFTGRAIRRMPDRKTKIRNILMVGLPCVVMPLVIICSVWESGYAIRYTADFSWQIIIGAVAVLFYLYRKSKNETKKNMLRAFMGISVVPAIMINVLQFLSFAYTEEFYPQICRIVQNTIAFWN